MYPRISLHPYLTWYLIQLRRLDSYRREIRLVREQRDEEGGREREAVKGILVLWKRLKDARKAQGYRNTSIKLVRHAQT